MPESEEGSVWESKLREGHKVYQSPRPIAQSNVNSLPAKAPAFPRLWQNELRDLREQPAWY